MLVHFLLFTLHAIDTVNFITNHTYQKKARNYAGNDVSRRWSNDLSFIICVKKEMSVYIHTIYSFFMMWNISQNDTNSNTVNITSLFRYTRMPLCSCFMKFKLFINVILYFWCLIFPCILHSSGHMPVNLCNSPYRPLSGFGILTWNTCSTCSTCCCRCLLAHLADTWVLC